MNRLKINFVSGMQEEWRHFVHEKQCLTRVGSSGCRDEYNRVKIFECVDLAPGLTRALYFCILRYTKKKIK